MKWKSLRKCSTVCFLIRKKVTGQNFLSFARLWKLAKIKGTFLPAKNNEATTSCKTAWDISPYFGLNSLAMILCLWSPLLLAIQDHAEKFEEQLWMEGRRKVSITSHRSVTSSDLKWVSQHFCTWSVSTHSSGLSFIPIVHPCAVFVTCHMIRVSFILYIKNYNCLLSFRFIFYFTNEATLVQHEQARVSFILYIKNYNCLLSFRFIFYFTNEATLVQHEQESKIWPWVWLWSGYEMV